MTSSEGILFAAITVITAGPTGPVVAPPATSFADKPCNSANFVTDSPTILIARTDVADHSVRIRIVASSFRYRQDFPSDFRSGMLRLRLDTAPPMYVQPMPSMADGFDVEFSDLAPGDHRFEASLASADSRVPNRYAISCFHIAD